MEKETGKLNQRIQEQKSVISNINREMSELKQKNQDQQSKIADLSHNGSWCAFQDTWTPVSVIKYDKIITADSTIINKDVLSWKYVLFCTNRLN